ncbi:conjugal transfer protein TraH [Amycolatopsis umgeniensis]|uniref:Uncharacterized protein n=1 Tax=Amycolatopsis umgeniensis TaxID=336628 RepID=A0A841B1Y9_9PSEU|nr:conjugal transfer protein TraH [Amycolatopsis umgeniensis]MBB5852504.1 hypothetical protein [Amycolatopsis umgeniensis]
MAERTPRRTRQETAVAWASTHAGELAGVAVPLVAGAVVSPWLCLLVVPGTAAWVASELRLRRTTRAARTSITSATAPVLSASDGEQDPGGGTSDQTDPAGSRERKEAHR